MGKRGNFGADGLVFVVYRNFINAALSLVQHMMHGQTSSFDVDLVRAVWAEPVVAAQNRDAT
jgi:hypothetical protein